ncbi:ABC transporter ATP-binding protein [Hoeflea alexandrii]|uniref:ABC transporter ATP-binding protein n=1 Tax=Hoeflea alexandrii TaxID=288436 RepID=UPI0022AFC9EF|nr:ABC transporter ATP-binding protein [Hoeflea alexandrii]MCZ4291557.1 ABC transporter ATP-binding protein [Hoeflea alexandrii]
MKAEAVMSVQDLRIEFPTRDRSQTVKAVDGVDFEVLRGETLGIIGESGSGKTTLGRALVSLVKPVSGRVLHGGTDLAILRGRELRRVRADYQIVFQDPNAALNPRMTILDSIIEPAEILGHGNDASRRRDGLDMLAQVGLALEVAGRYPHELSGGQKQRVNIARVLTVRPKVIVCDEVVAALDVSIRGSILNLFADLQRSFDLTYVFITHDISVVSHISDRIGVTYLGKLMELGPAEDVIDRPLHPYSQALLSAEPLPLPSNLRPTRRIILQGEIPSPLAPPSGCRFRTRCPIAEAKCAEEVPQWRQVRNGHWAACHFAREDGHSATGANCNDQKGGSNEDAE